MRNELFTAAVLLCVLISAPRAFATPDVDLNADSHDYGTVVFGEYRDWTLIIYNRGTSNLILHQPFDGLGDGWAIDVYSTVDYTIAPGDSHSFVFRFRPWINDLGYHETTIIVETNDPDEPRLDVRLTAYATDEADDPNTPGVNDGDNWDPGDDDWLDRPTVLSIGSTPRTHGPHTLSPSDPRDCFKFTLTKGQTYRFTGTGGSGDTVATLNVMMGNGILLQRGTDDDSGDDLHFDITHTSQSPANDQTTAEWVLIVTPYSENSNASYWLRYQRLSSGSGTGSGSNSSGGSWSGGGNAQEGSGLCGLGIGGALPMMAAGLMLLRRRTV